jgi:hypothetical protein
MGNLYQFGRIREYDAHNTYGYMEAKWTSKALLNVRRCFVTDRPDVLHLRLPRRLPASDRSS